MADISVDADSIALVAQVLKKSHGFMYSCVYGHMVPDALAKYQKDVRSWVDVMHEAVEHLSLDAEHFKFMQTFHRGFVVAGVDRNAEHQAYTRLMAIFGNTDIWGVDSDLLKRLRENHDTFDDLRALVLFFDYMGLPFEPLNLFPIPSADEVRQHRAVSGCVSSMVTYARWVSEAELVQMLMANHITFTAKNYFENGQQDERHPSLLDVQATRMLQQAVTLLQSRKRTEAKERFAQAKEKLVETLDRLEELCNDDKTRLESVDIRGHVSKGQNVFMQYGQQMVRISNYVTRLFDQADKFGHWYHGANFPGIWHLIRHENWANLSAAADTVASGKGVNLE